MGLEQHKRVGAWLLWRAFGGVGSSGKEGGRQHDLYFQKVPPSSSPSSSSGHCGAAPSPPHPTQDVLEQEQGNYQPHVWDAAVLSQGRWSLAGTGLFHMLEMLPLPSLAQFTWAVVVIGAHLCSGDPDGGLGVVYAGICLSSCEAPLL